MIEAHGLVKDYGARRAVDGVSFAAKRGEILGLLGPNGAGKSTVMRMLTGYLEPTAGSARLAGHPLATESLQARAKLGYLPENAGLYAELRVGEYLDYRATLKQVAANEKARAIQRALLACGLTESRERILGQLSKGFRQRVALAACLLNDPQVLILDEPSVGLDPLQVAEMRKLIRELGRDRTILFSTHVLSEAESVCDRVVILDRGKLLAEGTPADLAARFVARALHVELLGDADRALAAVATLREATAELLSREPTVRLRVTLPAPPVAESRAALARALAKADAVVIGLESEKTSLEEVFARVTQEAAA
ncbi:MAG TPA: ABC transporter ATP-binding protein [Planctomycetota bacterium]|nr:ABC transporter ATP-binding protein [Planctomycetota bacterium]